jgi:dipeptidyl aminopeptidase/acylaminoacyl peptidase
MTVNLTDGRLALQASSPKYTPRLIVIEGNQLSVIRTGMPEIITPEELPNAEPVSWKTKAGRIHGILYTPNHSEFVDEGLPPVILHVHSGPTSQVQANFSADTAFFTSRGFAYLSVNYRGSTGFGRNYREALDSNWGVSDVEDTLSAVDFLQGSGRVDPNRIVLKGSSAGGFTVLNTLIRYPGKFKAAICAYGVANLSTIVEETFKFESHYYDSLIGPLHESRELMRERSPIFKAEAIRDPILLFHGAEDPVVPISQTEEIVQKLIQNGTPYQYVRFENEGHGWRSGETLEAYYRTIEEFLIRYCLD